jgi:hypothetical protein
MPQNNSLCLRAIDLEIPNQWDVIGQLDLGDLKSGGANFWAVKYIIEFPVGVAAGIRKLTLDVSAVQAAGGEEKLKLTVPPQSIEITGHDDRLFAIRNEGVQIIELILTVAKFERQVDEKDGGLLEFYLDDQALDAFVKKMIPAGNYRKTGQNRIALFV